MIKKPDITHGDWKVTGEGTYNNAGYIINDVWQIEYSEMGECISEITHGKANAKLIASSPELLDTLIETHKTIKGLREGFEKSILDVPYVEERLRLQEQLIQEALQQAGCEFEEEL